MGVLHLHVRAYEPHCKFLQVLHQCRDDSWPLLRSNSVDLHNPTSLFYRANITVTVAGPSGVPLLKCQFFFGVQLGSYLKTKQQSSQCLQPQNCKQVLATASESRFCG